MFPIYIASLISYLDCDLDKASDLFILLAVSTCPFLRSISFLNVSFHSFFGDVSDVDPPVVPCLSPRSPVLFCVLGSGLPWMPGK